MLRYRTFGKTGLKVSEVCLGTMSFGTRWGFGSDAKRSRKVLDVYADHGGNFLDTANWYHSGETEQIVGNWLEGRRHEYVVGTKYSLTMNPKDPNTSGNHRKNLARSVEKSLERLQTDYIDILWVHAWDELTPFEETMRGLEDVVRSGKVLYIGISDAPAWIVSASNVLAELRGWTSYAGLQTEYSLIERSPERDLLPMADQFGLSTLAWAPIGGGVLAGKYTRGDRPKGKRQAGNEERGRLNERQLNIARTVDMVADEMGVTSAQVAIAWVASRGYGLIPVVGARRPSQIEDSLKATQLTIPPNFLSALERSSEISLGFPHDFLASDRFRKILYSDQHDRIDWPGQVA